MDLIDLAEESVELKACFHGFAHDLMEATKMGCSALEKEELGDEDEAAK